MLGGTLSAGPTSDGGYLVEAVLLLATTRGGPFPLIRIMLADDQL
jgi:hypothetical protein